MQRTLAKLCEVYQIALSRALALPAVQAAMRQGDVVELEMALIEGAL